MIDKINSQSDQNNNLDFEKEVSSIYFTMNRLIEQLSASKYEEVRNILIFAKREFEAVTLAEVSEINLKERLEVKLNNKVRNNIQ